MTDQPDVRDAGAVWAALTDDRRLSDQQRRLPDLDAPTGLVARPGRGQVTLDWDPVEGAAGYLVRRAAARDEDFVPLEIGEPWVRPVPHPPLTDTTGRPGEEARYTVAAVAAVDDHAQPQTEPVRAAPEREGAAEAQITIHAAGVTGALHRPWSPMIGSERLSQLHAGTGPGGREVGEEFAEALRMAHDELGVRAVRAHAILHDDVGVYREVDGHPVHDFAGVDAIYDRVLELGLRPIVEVSFMPRDLARDPAATVFEYRAIISPPKDWDRWGALVGDLTAHLVDRYGLEEVRSWGFEIWNEANLSVFWSGTQDEYQRLYDVGARAVKAVDPELPVGGPASAAVGWIDDFLDDVDRSGAPVDFVSTHTYGNAPLDLRPVTARHGRPELQLWWTEWGAHAGHFNPAHDSVWSAAYLARGMVSAMGRLDALAYWTVSDHFEELGRGPSLLHGGFGLLSAGNLRKPRWWALWMLDQLGGDRVAVDVEGDGAGDLVNAVATRDHDGRVAAVVWNGTVDVSKSAGDALLDRHVALRITELPEESYRLRHRRLDESHSNLVARWVEQAERRAAVDGTGEPPWPDADGWQALRETDHLADFAPPHQVFPSDKELRLEFDLPMPAVSLIELAPEH